MKTLALCNQFFAIVIDWAPNLQQVLPPLNSILNFMEKQKQLVSKFLQKRLCLIENQNDPIFEVNSLFLTLCFTISECYHALILLDPIHLKSGAVWTFTSTVAGITKWQSLMFVFHQVNFKVLTLTFHNFFTNWGKS